VASLLKEIREMNPSNPLLSAKIAEFDQGCQQIISKFGSIKPEKIEPSPNHMRFPFPTEGSTEFHFDSLIPDSISISEFIGGEFPARSISESQLSIDIHSDQFLRENIWQTRPYADDKIPYFDCAAFSKNLAAFASNPMKPGEKVLQVIQYRPGCRTTVTYPLPSGDPVESLCLAPQFAWVLSGLEVVRVPLANLARRDQIRTTRLSAIGTGKIALFGDGVVAVFPDCPSIFHINSRAEPHAIPTPYKGVRCVSGFRDNILCAVSNSGAVRMVASDGKEIRCFVGHCGPVIMIENLSETLFATRSDDETVRLWDVRDGMQLTTVSMPHVSVLSMTGSGNFLVCGFHNKKIGVIDLRKLPGKAILGVRTQDYAPVAIRFDPEYDSLAMFGVVEKDLTQNSMIFVESDGQSRQRIFREYSSFIGLGGDRK
jgi:WD40 repeat protein